MQLSDTQVTRRTFLGLSLSAIPVIGALASRLSLREATFILSFSDSEFGEFTIDLYSDGSIAASHNAHPMELTENDDRWMSFRNLTDGVTSAIRVRRTAPGEIQVDWLRVSMDIAPVAPGALPSAKYNRFHMEDFRPSPFV